jgi:starch phosphorylase
VAQQLKRLGADARQVDEAEELLDPEVLTLGFARRFATYKRGTLLFRDPERFMRILNHPTRPVQVIFAGKAHPDDQEGKRLIQNIIEHCRRPEFKHRIVFLEDYEINIARYLVQGVDVWLNTPRRPLEASGTSGMKVCPNGGLHLSVLDGWWDEAFAPEVGWAIGRGEVYDDSDLQDEIEAKALYDVIEREVAPLYYSRGEDGLPRGWVEKMKACVEQLSPVFNTNRMVREYSECYYLPSLELWRKLASDDYGRARKLAKWRKEIEGNWKNVNIMEVSTPDRAELTVGDQLKVSCLVDTGGLPPESLRVELYHGPIGPDAEVSGGGRTPMHRQQKAEGGVFRYEGKLVCDSSGKFGVALIVYPFTEELPSPFDLGLIVSN